MMSDQDNRHDALIFDLDGTLWDSTHPVAHAWNRALSRIGVQARLSHEDVASIMGLPVEQIFSKLFPDIPEGQRDKIAEKCLTEEIKQLRQQGAALFPGVEEGLQELAKHYPLFIVSNCQTEYMDTFFACTRLKHLFRDYECHGNTGKSKSDNIRAVKLRNSLKIPAYIGDTSGDHEAAMRAGVEYFHVDYGFGRPASECLHFAEFSDLVEYFTS